MTAQELTQKTDANIAQTHDALSLLYTSLPPGQQRTVLKNEEVRELLIRYNVIKKEANT